MGHIDTESMPNTTSVRASRIKRTGQKVAGTLVAGTVLVSCTSPARHNQAAHPTSAVETINAQAYGNKVLSWCQVAVIIKADAPLKSENLGDVTTSPQKTPLQTPIAIINPLSIGTGTNQQLFGRLDKASGYISISATALNPSNSEYLVKPTDASGSNCTDPDLVRQSAVHVVEDQFVAETKTMPQVVGAEIAFFTTVPEIRQQLENIGYVPVQPGE